MASPNPVPARRGSLVGPLIVLLLGVLFLANNLRPDLSLWRLVARYWPFLLIFWGGARLLEYLIARMTSRPIARAMTGGEVVLAVLICIAGSAFFAAERGDWRLGRLGSRSLEMFGQNYDFDVQGGQALPPDANLVIHNLQGDLRVVGADTQELKVSGRKSIKAFDRAGAEEADKATPLEITQQGTHFYVRTNQDRLSGDRRISADLVISVPKTVAVTLESRYGRLEVRDVAGPIEVNGSSTDVYVGNIAKNVRVTLRRGDSVQARQVKGNVEISGRGRDIDLQDILGTVTIDGGFSGNIKFQNLAKPVRYTSTQTQLSMEKVPGRMEMDLGSLTASDVVGPIRLSAHNKDVNLEDFSNQVELTTRRGDIKLRTSRIPLGNVQAETSSGNIELELPGNARFTLQATTANGRVENDFGDTVKTENRGNSAEMRGGAPASGPGGAGGAQIRLSTRRGEITFRKISPGQSL